MKKPVSLTLDWIKEEVTAQKAVFAVLVFCLLTMVCAQIKIPLPLTPVPFTLQVLAVFLCGYLLNSRLASMSLGLYLVLGMAGAPVFSGWGSGLSALMGPTGGYIAGFLPAVWAISYLSDKKVLGKFNSIVTALAGLGIIYFFGVMNLLFYIYFIMNLRGTELIAAALQLGIFPFILADLTKVAVAGSIFYGIFRGKKLS
jgi:biotin transport system substrate-specific component